MVLEEENYREVIESYTLEDWKPLFELIPEIEKTKEFGEIVGGRDENNVFQMPMWVGGDVINKFTDIIYKMPIVINFNWGKWEEGRKIAKDKSFDYDSIDIPTKCKLITAIVRNDRFCDGVLVSAFESGFILKILKSIERQVKQSSKV